MSTAVISLRGTMQSRTRSFLRNIAFSNNSVSTSSSSSPSVWLWSLINFSKSTLENSISCSDTFTPAILKITEDKKVINHTKGIRITCNILNGNAMIGKMVSAKTLNKTFGINSPKNKTIVVEITVCMVSTKNL